MKKKVMIQLLVTLGMLGSFVGCHKKSSVTKEKDTSRDTTHSGTDSQQFQDSDKVFYGNFEIVNETHVVLYFRAQDLNNENLDLFETSVDNHSSVQFYSVESESSEMIFPSKVFSNLYIDYDITGGIGNAYEGVIDDDWTQSEFDENNEKTLSLTITPEMVE